MVARSMWRKDGNVHKFQYSYGHYKVAEIKFTLFKKLNNVGSDETLGTLIENSRAVCYAWKSSSSSSSYYATSPQ